ncbi:TIR domain-containing protein [Xanthomonas cannabis]|uniref:TIR domain-containing protein n=1 Tax=Xanthomonas cannabis TaxID=1885674 RepID=UPI00141B057A|nr:TIR domain-containing protein [Xanthomonas cannabis]NIK02810.1 putative nucleotide-binding protein [Xanthomonas cannabis]NIK65003.1 putative nucleotide-binding protein [Xanthomonas cannabis]
MAAHEEIFQIILQLNTAAAELERNEIKESIGALDLAVRTVSRSFSGSWLGYHSRVYYENFKTPPPGAHFSQEWGLKDTFGSTGSVGHWVEYPFDVVKEHVLNLAGNPDLTKALAAASAANGAFENAKSEITSIIELELNQAPDIFIQKLNEQLQGLEVLSSIDFASGLNRRGQVMTRDTIVLGQGTQLPPHVSIEVELLAIQCSRELCKKAAEIARKAASHLERKFKKITRNPNIGTNVFIGHGRAGAWRELKDFIQDRLCLPWDEFNRIPVAGVTNVARLSEMLDASAIALLVMTAEDEMTDGSMQARMNVIHEAGLFQGRLGFSRAIVMLEDGCAEFSNVAGLGQIRFPRGNIAASFEETRRVLEREGLVEAS